MNYPVGDFLIKIKNAALAGRKEVRGERSKLIEAVAKALKDKGYLSEISKDEAKITVKINFSKKNPVLMDMKLVSSPGLRVYWSVDDLEKRKGPSLFLITTPKGVMFSDEAVKKRLGGEIIAEVI